MTGATSQQALAWAGGVLWTEDMRQAVDAYGRALARVVAAGASAGAGGGARTEDTDEGGGATGDGDGDGGDGDQGQAGA